MFDLFCLWFGAILRIFRNRQDLLLENLALRQQLVVLKRRHPKPTLGLLDKLFWVAARRFWSRWKESLLLVMPETVLTMSVPLGARKRRAIPAWSMAAGIAILFLGVVGYAKATGQWNTNLPRQIYLELAPNASAQEHPAPGPQ